MEETGMTKEDIGKELENRYGVDADRFVELVSEFTNVLGEFMVKEGGAMREAILDECGGNKEKASHLVYNALLNGLANYAVQKYAEAVGSAGYNKEQIRHRLLSHFGDIFDTKTGTKTTKHKVLTEAH